LRRGRDVSPRAGLRVVRCLRRAPASLLFALNACVPVGRSRPPSRRGPRQRHNGYVLLVFIWPKRRSRRSARHGTSSSSLQECDRWSRSPIATTSGGYVGAARATPTAWHSPRLSPRKSRSFMAAGEKFSSTCCPRAARSASPTVRSIFLAISAPARAREAARRSASSRSSRPQSAAAVARASSGAADVPRYIFELPGLVLRHQSLRRTGGPHTFA